MKKTRLFKTNMDTEYLYETNVGLSALMSAPASVLVSISTPRTLIIVKTE